MARAKGSGLSKPITSQGCIFTLRHVGLFGISVKNTSDPSSKYENNYF